MTAWLIDAVETARIRLVSRVVPAGELMPWALETADRITSNSPSSVQAVKRQVSATIAEHVRAREALDQALGDQVPASPRGLLDSFEWCVGLKRGCRSRVEGLEFIP